MKPEDRLKELLDEAAGIVKDNSALRSQFREHSLIKLLRQKVNPLVHEVRTKVTARWSDKHSRRGRTAKMYFMDEYAAFLDNPNFDRMVLVEVDPHLCATLDVWISRNKEKGAMLPRKTRKKAESQSLNAS